MTRLAVLIFLLALFVSAPAAALVAFESRRCESDIKPGIPLGKQPPSWRDCGMAAWTVADDGTGARRITTPVNTAAEHSPYWYADFAPKLSPTSRFVATYRTLPEGGSRLYVVASDGAWEREVSPRWPYEDINGRDVEPAWSPDERRLVFTSTRPHPSGAALEVHRLDLQTGALVQLTNDETRKYDPGFSPDGRRIVFTAEATPTIVNGEISARGSEDAGTFTIDAEDGGDKRRITTPGLTATSPVYSPDGSYLALVAGASIYVMRVDGSDLRQIVAHEPDFRGPLDVGWGGEHPAWADDGKAIVFKGCGQIDDTRGGCAIFKQRLDDLSAEPEQITNYPFDNEPSWAVPSSGAAKPPPLDEAGPALGLMSTGIPQTTDDRRAGASSARRGVFKARPKQLLYFGADGTGLRRIDASIAAKRRDGRCTFLTARGKRRVGRCAEPIWFRVSSPARWLKQLRRLATGRRYDFRLRGTDVRGNRTRRPERIEVLLKR